MSRDVTALKEVLALADQIEDIVSKGPFAAIDRNRVTEQHGFSIATHHAYSFGMYVRARSFFQSVLLLVRTGRSDEALALGRSLFEDSLRLATLVQTESERDQVDALATWLNDGLERAAGLFREAKEIGLGHGHHAAVEALEARSAEVRAFWYRKGTGRRNAKILKEQNLETVARQSGRSHGWWLHEVADQMVHGNLFSHQLRAEALTRGRLGIALRLAEPGALIDIVAFAAESLVVSHKAMTSLADKDFDHELDLLMRRIESIQHSLM